MYVGVCVGSCVCVRSFVSDNVRACVRVRLYVCECVCEGECG